jgi:hypothetical protein
MCVCVCLVAQYIPNTPQGLQGLPVVWMVYWTWLARVARAEIEMLTQVTKTKGVTKYQVLLRYKGPYFRNLYKPETKTCGMKILLQNLFSSLL